MSKNTRTDEEVIEDFIALLANRAADLLAEADDTDEDEDDDTEEAEDDSEDDSEDPSDDEDDDDAEDDDDGDEEDGGDWDEESLSLLDRDELKEVATDWEVEFTPKTATKTLITAILEAQAAEDGDDEEEADEDEDEDEDASDEFWTKAELDPKSIGEIRTIAKEYDIATKGKTKDDLISEIVSA